MVSALESLVAKTITKITNMASYNHSFASLNMQLLHYSNTSRFDKCMKCGSCAVDQGIGKNLMHLPSHEHRTFHISVRRFVACDDQRGTTQCSEHSLVELHRR